MHCNAFDLSLNLQASHFRLKRYLSIGNVTIPTGKTFYRIETRTFNTQKLFLDKPYLPSKINSMK
jgi:hypothetical protein